MMNANNEYVFIIDLDGNACCEREIAAYCTGIISEYGPEDISEEFQNNYPEMYSIFESKVDCGYKFDDDVPCPDPCTTFITPGWIKYCPGGKVMDFKISDVPSNIEQLYLKNVEDYFTKEIAGIEKLYNQNPGYIHSLNSIKNRYEECKIWPAKTWPVHNSVGIHFYNEPTKEEIDFMKSRAYEFAKNEGLNIDGFRLMISTTIENYVEI